MKFLSRDPNIVQFMGCCVLPDALMLVTELLEVRRKGADMGGQVGGGSGGAG